MTARLFHCPSCGAPVIPRGSASVLSCPYCNASVEVPENLRQVSDVETWSTIVFDNFILNNNNWMVGSLSDNYFATLNRAVADGRYRWEGQASISSTIAATWLIGYQLADFHLVVNCKHIRGSRAGSSYGVVFRIQDNRNYYWFHITDHQHFSVAVVKDSQWVVLVDWTRTETIKPNGVNQVEVIAYKTHFTFLINGQIVSEVDDDLFRQGLVGLAIEGYTPGEEIAFDFLDLVLRAP